MARGRRVAARLVLLGVSLVVALGASELALRLVLPPYSPLFLAVYEQDASGNLVLRPNVSRRLARAEFSVRVDTNAEGMRDRVAPLPDDGGTVLALGDSFAFGWGVEVEESYLYLAEEILRPRAVRVVKAGVPSTGTVDQRDWLATHGERYRPDVVVVSLFVGNDIADNAKGGVRGQYVVRDGVLVKAASREETASRWYRLRQAVKTRSVLAQSLARAWWGIERRLLRPQDRPNAGLAFRASWMRELLDAHLRNPPTEVEHGFAATLAALDDVDAWCREHGATLLLVVIPQSFQVHEWELARLEAAFQPGELDLDRPQRILGDWSRARGVRILDLLEPLRAHAVAHPDEPLYFHPDGHLDVAGSRVVALPLAAAIEGCLTRQAATADSP